MERIDRQIPSVFQIISVSIFADNIQHGIGAGHNVPLLTGAVAECDQLQAVFVEDRQFCLFQFKSFQGVFIRIGETAYAEKKQQQC